MNRNTSWLGQWISAASLAMAVASVPMLAAAQPTEHTEHGATEQGNPATTQHESGHEPGPGHGPENSQSHGEHGEPGEHGAQHGEHATGPEPINWTTFGGTRTDAHTGAQKPNPPPFIALLLNFSLVLVVLYLAIQRLINPALAARRAAIQAELSEAQRVRAEVEQLRAEYKKKLEKLEEEAAELKAEFVRSGEAEHAKIIAEATARAEKIEADAHAQMQQELRQLQAEVRRHAIEAAMTAAETAIRGQINGSDQNRIADSYLNEIERADRAGGQA